MRTLQREGYLGAASAARPILVCAVAAAVALLIGLFGSNRLRARALTVLLLVGAALCMVITLRAGAVLAVAVTLSLVLLGWAAGDWLIDRCFRSGQAPHGYLRVVFAVALAWGISAHVVLALSLIGQVKLPTVIALLSVLAVALRGRLLRNAGVAVRFVGYLRRRTNTFHVSWFTLSTVALLVAVFLIDFVETVAPEIQYDSLNYHLSVIQLFIEQGRFVLTPQVMQSYFYLSTEMNFLVAMLLGGQIAAKLVHFCFLVLNALAIFGFGRQISSQRTGALAAALFVSTPLIVWESSTTYTDLALTLYCFLTAVAVVFWLRKPATGWLLAAGACAGFAVSAKLAAGLVLLPVAAALALGLCVRPATSWPWRLRQALAFALAAILTATPWPVLRYAQTGNPVPPFFNGIFKSPLWPAVNGSMNFSIFGIGTQPANLVRLPWAMTFDASHFIESVPDAVLGLSLLIVPLVVLVRPLRLWMFLIGAVLIGFTLLWAFAVQYLRYFLPAIPLACLLAAEVLAALSHRWSAVPRVLVLVVLASAVPLVAGMYFNIPERIPLNVAFGAESREAYLRRTIATYEAFERIGEAAGTEAHTLSLGEGRWLYAPGLLESEASPRVQPILNMSDPVDIGAFLREYGFTHVLVYRGGMESAGEAFRVATPQVLAPVAELVWAGRDVVLYRVRSADEQAMYTNDAPVNLLINGGFDEVDAGGPVGWAAYGRPVLVTTAERSHAGSGAARVSGEGGYVQSLSVAPGRLYTLSHYSRTDEPGSMARLQVNWIDAAGTLVDTSIVVVQESEAWTRHEMTAIAPVGATSAVVYANAQNGDVLVDDVELVALH